MGLEFHTKLGFGVTNQGGFLSSLSHVRSVHLLQLNTDILHELWGDLFWLPKQALSGQGHSCVIFFYFFTAAMYNQEGGGCIFQTSMLEVKILNP